MYEKFLRLTALVTCLMASVAVSLILYVTSVKTIVIAEDITAGAGMSRNAEQELKMIEDSAKGDYLCIPLPEGILPDNIVIENRYIDHTVNILITGASESFYEKSVLHGNLGQIGNASFSENDSVVKLQFELNGLYEHHYVFENSSLNLKFVPPKELYDKIVVIDAAHGGTDLGCSVAETTEKQITLDIVRRLREKLENTGIRAYYTRIDDANPEVKARALLANQARADLLISVHVNADEEDTASYGTLARYNDRYVIPVFGNVELADILERQVVTAIDGRAIGLAQMTEQDILSYAQVPAASIEVGYLTNATDAALLENEEYRDKIADGILRAIQEVYKKLEK